MKDLSNILDNERVLIKCKVKAVYSNRDMIQVTTKECPEGLDIHASEIFGECPDNKALWGADVLTDALNDEDASAVFNIWKRIKELGLSIRLERTDV